MESTSSQDLIVMPANEQSKLDAACENDDDASTALTFRGNEQMGRLHLDSSFVLRRLLGEDRLSRSKCQLLHGIFRTAAREGFIT